MTALFTLLPIFGFATLFYIFFKKSVSVSIFFSISFIITILFAFGMLEYLQIGSYVLFYGGAFLLIVMGIIYDKQLIKAIITVPFVMFVVTSVVYLYFMKDAQLFFWDEYSHWGAFIKYMYSTNSFYDLSANAAHLYYPPGITLWDYFVLNSSSFNEGTVYFAYFLILFSSTLMMYEKLSFRNIHWIVLVLIGQIILFAGFGHWLSCIYVDHIIGALFAGLVLSYLADNFRTKELLLFLFPLVTIALIKDIGLYFGLSFLGLVIILSILNTKIDNKLSLFYNIKLNKKIILISSILFISMVLVLNIWSQRQESAGVAKSGQSITNVVKNIFSDKNILDDKTTIEVKKRFWEVVNYQQLHKEEVSLNYNEFSYGIMSKYEKNIKLSTTGSMLFFIGMFILFFILTKDKNKRTEVSLIYGYMLFVTIVYLFILYFSFLVAFGNGALRIPSFVRYMNMGILPMFIVGFALMLPMFNKKINSEEQNKIKQFILPVFIIILLGIIVQPYLKPMYSQLNNGFRVTADNITVPILKQVKPKEKIFVIFPIKNNGSLNNILRYSLIPTKATISSYDFENKSFQEMVNIYSKYDYIWFVQLNQNLLEKNKAFLKGKVENQAYMLYKVEVDNTNIKFVPVL